MTIISKVVEQPGGEYFGAPELQFDAQTSFVHPPKGLETNTTTREVTKLLFATKFRSSRSLFLFLQNGINSIYRYPLPTPT
jgi:hypothetical protein